jgi:hypothetical protein
MKQIKINSCKNCPWHSFLFTNTCKHPQASGMLIEDVNQINSGCPLEDLQKNEAGT